MDPCGLIIYRPIIIIISLLDTHNRYLLTAYSVQILRSTLHLKFLTLRNCFRSFVYFPISFVYYYRSAAMQARYCDEQLSVRPSVKCVDCVKTKARSEKKVNYD